MLTTSEIRTIYEKIQKQLFYMIPEKWDRVYLYASVLDHHNNVQTGEMFFYYYPKSLLRKNPVNVYEVPNKFNIDEQAYLRLAEKLYKEIKRLRTYLIKMGEEPWSNLTIRIQDFKFNIDYSYEDLVDSSYTSYDRHLIWRYKYLNVPISSYSKKDRNMLERYLAKGEYYNQNITTYSEGLYRVPVSNIIDYNHVSADYKYNEEQQYIKRKRVPVEDTDILPATKNIPKKDYIAADTIKMPEQPVYTPVFNYKEDIYSQIGKSPKEEYVAPVNKKAYKVANTILTNDNIITNIIEKPNEHINKVILQDNIDEIKQVKNTNKVTIQEEIEDIKKPKKYINKVTWYEPEEEPKKQYVNKVTWYEPEEEEEPRQYVNKVTWYEVPEEIEENEQYINMQDGKDFTQYNNIETEEPMSAKAVNQILGFM